MFVVCVSADDDVVEGGMDGLSVEGGMDGHDYVVDEGRMNDDDDNQVLHDDDDDDDSRHHIADVSAGKADVGTPAYEPPQAEEE